MGDNDATAPFFFYFSFFFPSLQLQRQGWIWQHSLFYVGRDNSASVADQLS